MQEKFELISTVLDGETDDVHANAVDNMTADAGTRSVWARYQLIGEVMRDNHLSEHLRVSKTTIAEQVRMQIESEPAILAPQSAKRPRADKRKFLQPIAGLAIAASVAAIAVIGIRGPDPVAPQDAANQLSVSSMDAAEKVLSQVAAVENVATGDAVSGEESELEIDLIEHQRRLNSYLVNFNEQRSSLGVPGVNPYVRIVGFESE